MQMQLVFFFFFFFGVGGGGRVKDSSFSQDRENLNMSCFKRNLVFLESIFSFHAGVDNEEKGKPFI